MEEVIAIAIGVLAASGVWLMLRPRTFQVVMGLCLLSYAVNLFIFSMGSLSVDKSRSSRTACRRPAALHRPAAPGAGADGHRDRLRHDGAVPGGAAGARGLSGTDHVDGRGAGKE
jgi:multicomponent K+:H+ antiporter subunit C